MSAALPSSVCSFHFRFFKDKRVVHSIFVRLKSSCFALKHSNQHPKLFNMQHIPVSRSRNLRVALEGCVCFRFRLGYSNIDILVGYRNTRLTSHRDTVNWMTYTHQSLERQKSRAGMASISSSLVAIFRCAISPLLRLLVYTFVSLVLTHPSLLGSAQLAWLELHVSSAEVQTNWGFSWVLQRCPCRSIFDYLCWRKPWSQQSSLWALLWRVGSPQHLLSWRCQRHPLWAS